MSQGITVLLTNSPLEVGLFQARLDIGGLSSPSNSVQLTANRGNYIEVQGVLMDLTAASVNYTFNNSTDTLINSTGGDTAASPAASTLYYLYASNNKASYAPGRLRASTTAPTTTAGVKYLGTSGNALNWRFVGWAKTDGFPRFTDSETARLVVSYYNRKKEKLFACPARSDGNNDTSYTSTSTTWVQANAGTGSKAEYIANGEDAVSVKASSYCQHSGAGGVSYIGIGLSSTSNCTTTGIYQSYAATAAGNAGIGHVFVPAEGYQYIELLVRASGATATFFADLTRNGGNTDPYGTLITAEVMI